MSSPTAPSSMERLAILAFESEADDDRGLALGTGIAEELCHALSGTRGLRVTPSEAALRYQGASAEALRDAGRRLGADHVLGGQVKLEGGALHVQARLVHCGRAEEATLGLALPEDGITGALAALVNLVASNLRAPIAEDALYASLGTRDDKAVIAVLDGRQGLRKRAAPALERAVSRFRSALELDPDLISANVGLFQTLAKQRLLWRKGDAALDAEIDARLQRLRELDPDGVRLNWYAILPESAGLTFWDVAGREAHARAAVLGNRVGPDLMSSARHLYADGLSESGLFHGAIAYLELCEAEEPPHANRWSLMGQLHAIVDDLPRAERWLRRAIELDPSLIIAHTYLIAVLERSGDHAAAAVELARIESDLGPDLTAGVRAHGHYCRGEMEALRPLVEQVDATAAMPGFFRGICRLMIDDVDGAIARFEEGYRDNDRFVRMIREKIPFYFGMSTWDRLVSQQRFRMLLRTMNLDDNWRTTHMHHANELTEVTGIEVSG